MSLYIGTSGYSYKDWRGIFYPKGVAQKNWLSYYAERYNTVEINATFYGHFEKHVFARWRDDTPETFVFTLKGPRSITHVKRLADAGDDIERFLEGARALGTKLSALLWQLPPGFKYDSQADFDQLAAFLAALPADVRQVVEFRHESWFRDDVYGLLNARGAGFCINDSSKFPARDMDTGGFSYVRFHGPEALYASLYSLEQMAAWAERLRPRLDQGDVYCYFNNDWDGRALRNANELRDLLAA